MYCVHIPQQGDATCIVCGQLSRNVSDVHIYWLTFPALFAYSNLYAAKLMGFVSVFLLLTCLYRLFQGTTCNFQRVVHNEIEQCLLGNVSNEKALQRHPPGLFAKLTSSHLQRAFWC